LLNTNLKLPWILNRQPTFTGILHVGEEVPITKTAATINDKYSPNIIVNGNEIIFTPDYGLDYGFNRVYVSVAFENGHIACAYWNFEVKKNPPQISGFLGDAKGRRYFICFDGEIDSKKIEDKSNWKLNGSSDLIEKVNYMDFGDWAVVYLVDESKHENFRDQDYHLSYDAGRGSTEFLLIPEERQPRDGGGGRDGGCGEIVYNDETDKHLSVESEFHAITYKVIKEPDCNLEVEWILDVTEVPDVTNECQTALNIDKSHIQHMDFCYGANSFPVAAGHYTLYFPWCYRIQMKVKVWDSEDPPNLVWESPSWDFPLDAEPPQFVVEPILMNGDDAGDFVLDKYYELFGQGAPVPLGIVNMILFLKNDFNKCRQFFLWAGIDMFGKDESGNDKTHLGCLDEYISINYGFTPDADSPICFNVDLAWPLDAFSVDLHPESYLEHIEWSDPDHNPLPMDKHLDGEFKLWVLDYWAWIGGLESQIRGHEDTFTMRPVLKDTPGTGESNWVRYPNIYQDLSIGCDGENVEGLVVHFIEPAEERKQFINLEVGEKLPEDVPDIQRENKIDVIVEVELLEPYWIAPGTKLRVFWKDPEIDTEPMKTMTPFGPKAPTERPKFPWLTDSRDACLGDEVWPFGSPSRLFPDPRVHQGAWQIDPVDPGQTPDNSDSSEYSVSQFSNCSNNVYHRILPYQRGGFIQGHYYRTQEIDLAYYFNNTCDNPQTFPFKFYTSNFAGDNYKFFASIVDPDNDPVEVTCEVAESPIIHVWRKAYVEFSEMRHDDDPNVCCENEDYEYPHFEGPYNADRAKIVDFAHKMFDDCFIDLQEGRVDRRDLGDADEPPEEIDKSAPGTLHEDMVSDGGLPSYSDDWTHLEDRLPPPSTTPHVAQVLSIDGYEGSYCPCFDPESIEKLGFATHTYPSGLPISAILVGSTTDLIKGLGKHNAFAIDGHVLRNIEYIKIAIALHELSHGFGLYYSAIDPIACGHKSGPGILWSEDNWDCSMYDALTFRKSHLWGDHVFLMRFNPRIP